MCLSIPSSRKEEKFDPVAACHPTAFAMQELTQPHSGWGSKNDIRMLIRAARTTCSGLDRFVYVAITRIRHDVAAVFVCRATTEAKEFIREEQKLGLFG